MQLLKNQYNSLQKHEFNSTVVVITYQDLSESATPPNERQVIIKFSDQKTKQKSYPPHKKSKAISNAHFNLKTANSKLKWQKLSINKLVTASYSPFSFITYLENIHLQEATLDRRYFPFHCKLILTSYLLWYALGQKNVNVEKADLQTHDRF